MKMNLRVCVGPRGGRHELPTPCAACVAFASCRPGACTEFWGCESWVDEEGRRPVVEAPAWRAGGPGHECVKEMCPDCNPLPGPDDIDRLDIEEEEAAPSFVGVVGSDPDGSGPVLVAYVDPPAPFEPEALGAGQGVLPMADAGPLFAGLKRGRT